MFSSASFWNFVRMLAVTLTSAVLAACAQSSVTKKSELRAASRQVSLEERRNTPSVMNRGLAAKTNKHTPFAANKNAAETQIASYGLASFYSDEQQTANGEKFKSKRLDRCSPYIAIRHPVARDERRYWAVGNGQGQ